MADKELPERGALVTLREITKDTLRGVLSLRVHETQARFVADNATSIAQAHFSEEAWFRAIYAGEVPVGFVMLSLEPAKPEYWIWRLMIDRAHQGKGFGRAAIGLVEEHVRDQPGARELLLSHVQAEGNPGAFYESLSFEYTGDVDQGELVMRKKL
jgi:diamine N-acetyltransferase